MIDTHTETKPSATVGAPERGPLPRPTMNVKQALDLDAAKRMAKTEDTPRRLAQPPIQGTNVSMRGGQQPITTDMGQQSVETTYHATKIERNVNVPGIPIYRLFTPQTGKSVEFTFDRAKPIHDLITKHGIILGDQTPIPIEWDVTMAIREGHLEVTKVVTMADKKKPDDAKPNRWAQYMGWYGKVCADYHVPDGEATRNEIRHAAARTVLAAKGLPTDNLSFTDLPDGIALQEIERATLDALKEYGYGPARRDDDMPSSSTNSVSTDAGESDGEKPSNSGVGNPIPAAANGGAGDGTNHMEGGTSEKKDKPVQSEPTTIEKAPLPEAPFSANFHMVEPHGVEVQLTVRTDTVAEGLKQVEFTIERLLKAGWTSTRRDAIQTAQPANGNGASAPVTADEGLSPCIMIKVGKTFKGDKDQIVFEVPDVTDDVKYSSKDANALVKILSGLRKLDGSAITASDLTNGAKLAVQGKVSWKRDGKYVNVLGTAAADRQ